MRWVGQNICNTISNTPSFVPSSFSSTSFWFLAVTEASVPKFQIKGRGSKKSITNVLTNSPYRKLLLHSNGFWRLDIIHSLQNYFNSYFRYFYKEFWIFCVWLISRSWHFQKSFICKDSLKHSSYHHYAIHYNWIKGIKTVKDYFWCPKSFTET